MSFIDRVLGQLIRVGPEGRRFYAPLGRRGALFEVPTPELEARIIREFKAMLATVAVAALAWTFLLTSDPIGLFGFLFVLWLAAGVFGIWMARGLPKADVRWKETRLP